MDPYVRRFIKAALAWLGAGIVIGLAMTWAPAQTLAYRTAHLHINLLGFVSMMIFGVAYHVIPRFTGRQLHAARLVAVHFWAANIGLASLAAGWIARAHAFGAATGTLHLGAVLSAAGAGMFIYNIWLTIGDGAPAPHAIGPRRAP
jgi:heme/copper-type cytochrome/quinol oxidase subunit 1